MPSDVTLQKILRSAGITVEKFKNDYWGKKSLYIPNAIIDQKEFFSKIDFEHALNSDAPWNWGAIEDAIDDDDAHKRSDKGSPVIESMNSRQAKILRDLGLYLLVRNPEVSNRNIANFLASLNTELSAMTKRFEVILFQGHPGKGLSLHNDPIELFNFQLEGHKKWTFAESPFPLSTVVFKSSNLGYYITNGAREGEVLSFHDYPQNFTTLTMNPGDFLYLPAFTLHETSNNSDYTLSLSILRENKSYINTLQEAMQELCPEEWFRLFDCRDVPKDLEELKKFYLKQIDSLRYFIAEKDFEFYSHAFASYSKSHSTNTFRLNEIEIKQNLSVDSRVRRNPIYSALLVESDHFPAIYIDGKEYSFEEKKWFKFVKFLASPNELSIKDLLKYCELSEAEIPELLENLRILQENGAIIVRNSTSICDYGELQRQVG